MEDRKATSTAVTKAGCQGFRTSVDHSGRGRTMAVIKSVDNEAFISVVPNLPVTRFI